MALGPGDTLPEATLLHMGAEGPAPINLSERIAGKKVVIFALPGAYTGTCTTSHVPSFMRTRDQFAEKGVDEVICVSVNDPFVMGAWGESTGATEAGITMLADASSEFTGGMGMAFDAPPVGLVSRSKRYAMVVEDGKITVLQEDANPGVCDLSGGEALLDAL